jgi:8-oxo-dGTP pyrophosphatase MutT (NUDIX family)
MVTSFDPLKVPVTDHGDPAAAIDAASLQAERLRHAFASPQPWHVEVSDEASMRAPRSIIRPAAVLIPLMLRPDGITVLLTQRTAHLSDHGGQISFPGGRVEESDATRVETALREAEEEVGLSRGNVEVIGELPEYLTVTGYIITPVVALVVPPGDDDWKLDRFEVAHALEPPLAFLMNPGNHERRSIEWQDAQGVSLRRHFYSMPWTDKGTQHFIWGATAAMIRNLHSFLRAQSL